MNRLLISSVIILGSGCHSNGGGAPIQGKVTVHDVLTDARLVGRTVEVTGRCLGYSVPTIARGTPPVTRSDWQLEDRGEAVWVTGPLPEGCGPTAPAPGATTVSAMVAQDTLRALGEVGGVRQYLRIR